MSLAFDEYGRPFVIIKEGEKKGRTRGLAAQKANILAAKAVTSILKTSLGPKGMDKILQPMPGALRSVLKRLILQALVLVFESENCSIFSPRTLFDVWTCGTTYWFLLS